MDKKKLAAAISAVMTHIKTSEEASAYYAAEASEAMVEPQAAIQAQQVLAPSNAWGMSGRQSQMQANTMMQLRVFK